MNITSQEFIRVYTCLSDLARLRILGLLLDGPLCVCHIHDILELPQPKVSRHLNLMKKHGLLTSSREFNWSIYRISSNQSPVLSSALKCLQDARSEMPVFRRDQGKRKRVIDQLRRAKGCCPSAVVPLEGSNNPRSVMRLPSAKKQTTKTR